MIFTSKKDVSPELGFVIGLADEDGHANVVIYGSFILKLVKRKYSIQNCLLSFMHLIISHHCKKPSSKRVNAIF